jgi:hypothetical protein
MELVTTQAKALKLFDMVKQYCVEGSKDEKFSAITVGFYILEVVIPYVTSGHMKLQSAEGCFQRAERLSL